MPDQDRVLQRTATVEQRVDALQAALDEHGLKASEAVEELSHLAEEQWVPQNGARVVAKAWVDPAFRERLLANGLTPHFEDTRAFNARIAADLRSWGEVIRAAGVRGD